jgi:hypothetical protein
MRPAIVSRRKLYGDRAGASVSALYHREFQPPCGPSPRKFIIDNDTDRSLTDTEVRIEVRDCAGGGLGKRTADSGR